MNLKVKSGIEFSVTLYVINIKSWSEIFIKLGLNNKEISYE